MSRQLNPTEHNIRTIISTTPGTVGLGVEGFVIKNGLSTVHGAEVGAGAGGRRGLGQRNESGTGVNDVEEGNLEDDIQSLFSIRLNTPDRSAAASLMKDEELPEPRLQISQPHLLTNSTSQTMRRNGTRNLTYDPPSSTPTSFAVPSWYYKLGNVWGISGSCFNSSPREHSSLSDSVH
ncbi:hypothetical protein JAAARDRAFT_198551 [Jaapia argillacea MUCL 33604]|uniref:Uncharacterized protein n=1 Tax=Jaapia argillacea MUCL 33604 TaxID=933084 RepID=A0A067PE75_9AGAM|nr:hypothetical protein JAAARDRAFT_198551 [Jaapia argillacea MUCL 33604]